MQLCSPVKERDFVFFPGNGRRTRNDVGARKNVPDALRLALVEHEIFRLFR